MESPYAVGFVLTPLLSRHRCCTLGIWGFPTAAPFTITVGKNRHLGYLSLLCGSDAHKAVRLVYSPSLLLNQRGSSILSLYTFTFLHSTGVCVRGYAGGGGRERGGGWLDGILALCVEQTFSMPKLGLLCVRLRESLRLPSQELLYQTLPFVVPGYSDCCPAGSREPSCRVDMNTPLPCILTCFLRR